ncbi:MAG: DUF86 domain-containing protein [Meiothermus sp.]|uniref:HepT-like ribonuclease domain-containing protein n=1 Tax=Meiothermus sp. TaxID=1955249 RepID=UPI0025D30126|nr:HepT-like ribonuclease domain-containing protein [Meiothermus sp.]MCS7069279.1 DUF86 domain-containing protein [Meiothermus sp.]
MPLRAQAYLFDIIQAIEAIEEFTRGQTFESYHQSRLLVSAVERQLSIVGEAITQLLKIEPNAPINAAKQIVGFRNILIHNYARVSQAVIWKIVQDDLPVLKAEAQTFLERLEA